MTTITDAGREALRKRWKLIADDESASNSLRSEARTILALLDAPRLPRPEDVPDEVLDEMWMDAAGAGGGKRGMKVALQVHYDHYAAPPQPKKAEAWGVLVNGHEHSYWWVSESKAACEYKASQSMSPDRYRIVKLTEDRDGE